MSSGIYWGAIDREEFWVAYHQEKQVAMEIWSIDGTMFAELPWGEQYTGEQAREILNNVMQSDQITMRKIESGCDQNV